MSVIYFNASNNGISAISDNEFEWKNWYIREYIELFSKFSNKISNTSILKFRDFYIYS